HFETELHARYPDSSLVIRNMCDGGNTPGFRPHSGYNDPWAFPGAEKFQTELANRSNSIGHFEKPDQWLSRLETDIIIACFGYNESFAGAPGIDNFKAELDAFVKHTLGQKYNGTTAPQLALVSPIAFQDLSAQHDFPDGKKENVNLLLYADAIAAVADSNDVLFVDAFRPSEQWYASKVKLTSDGSQLNDAGYQKFGQLLADEVFGPASAKAADNRTAIHAAVQEKNWMWHNDFKIPNGVHVFGRRYDPFGPDNYPFELKKIREMTAVRDQAIWKAALGESFDLAKADANTAILPAVETNYKIGDNGRGSKRYLYGQEALDKMTVPAGYKVELFASEKEFPNLANPVQLSFDNEGRLWVAVMPSYPHYR
ncbi:MAG: dehydrogenase, partial [Bacteroidota bacterium]